MSDDDEPKLSEHAIAALRQFYAEQNDTSKNLENNMPKENWVCANDFESLPYGFTLWDYKQIIIPIFTYKY